MSYKSCPGQHEERENIMSLAVEKRARVFIGVLFWLVFGLQGVVFGAVVLNEFMAANTNTIADEDGNFDDWIELYNSSAGPVNIGNYCLSDASSQPAKWRFPAGTIINAGEHLLIWADDTIPPNPARPLHTNFKLGGEEGEIIGLYAADGATTLDAIRYGQQAPDVSYGRWADYPWPLWGPFRRSTPRKPNLGYTPAPDPLAGKLFINEWLTSNTHGIRDPSGRHEDWFEIYSASGIPIDLGGLWLTDNLAQPGKWQIPTGNVIGHYGFAFFWADKDPEQGAIHADFNLSDQGEELGLYKQDGATFIRIDSVVFGPQRANISQGRKPDGSANFEFFTQPTPRSTNAPSTRVLLWQLYR